MEKKRNRNAVRSINMLADAYFELLCSQRDEKITVTAIVNKAGLNRSTFYAHFDSPEDVRRLIEKRLSDELTETINSLGFGGIMKDPKPLLDIVAKRLESRSGYLKALFETHPAGEWLENIKEALINKFMSDAETACAGEDRDALLINLRFFVGGYISLCRDYIDNKLSIPPSALSESLAKTIAAGLAAGSGGESGRNKH